MMNELVVVVVVVVVADDDDGVMHSGWRIRIEERRVN